MISGWIRDEDGERYPEYSQEQLLRISRAAWAIQHLVPHPDDIDFGGEETRAAIREFRRALECLPKLDQGKGA